MSNAVFAQILNEQFNDAFDVLAASIASFTPREWVTGDSPFDGPARGVAHALQCAEFYTKPDRSIFTNLGKPVWQMTEADLPSQDCMTAYLEKTRGMTMAWVDGIAEIGFDQPSGPDGTIGLSRVVYALRHLQHHTGDVCAHQKLFGHPQEKWD